MTITVRVRPKAAATTGAGSFTSAIESVSIPASMAAPANPWSANTRSGGAGGLGRAGPRLFQAAEHSDGIHRDRAVDPGRRDVGVEARSLAHQRHHLALREHGQAGQAELRAGIAGGELGDLPPNVRPV